MMLGSRCWRGRLNFTDAREHWYPNHSVSNLSLEGLAASTSLRQHASDFSTRVHEVEAGGTKEGACPKLC